MMVDEPCFRYGRRSSSKDQEQTQEKPLSEVQKHQGIDPSVVKLQAQVQNQT